MSWAMIGASTIATAGSLGGAYMGRKGGEMEFPEARFLEEPELPEAKGARQAWWSKLQEFGEQPGYGAIAPDWGDIWGRAKKKVKQYYWGGPEGGGGLAGKVKASAARRGVSDSPALQTELTKMGMGEAGVLGDIASEQSLQEALFGEKGRLNWLQNIAQVAGLRKPGAWQSATPTPTSGAGMALANLGGDISNLIGTYGQRNWYESLLDKYSGIPGKTPSGITEGGSELDALLDKQYQTPKMVMA